MSVRRVREQFNLLLLDEGEYYFDDVVAVHREMGKDGSSGRWREGRIKLCSHSVFFAPDDCRYSVVRLPFRFLTDPPTQSGMDDRSRIIFSTSQSTRMRENNLNQPYDFRKGHEEHEFSTPYMSVETVLRKILTLWNVFQESDRLRSKVFHVPSLPHHHRPLTQLVCCTSFVVW